MFFIQGIHVYTRLVLCIPSRLYMCVTLSTVLLICMVFLHLVCKIHADTLIKIKATSCFYESREIKIIHGHQIIYWHILVWITTALHRIHRPKKFICFLWRALWLTSETFCQVIVLTIGMVAYYSILSGMVPTLPWATGIRFVLGLSVAGITNAWVAWKFVDNLGFCGFKIVNCIIILTLQLIFMMNVGSQSHSK